MGAIHENGGIVEKPLNETFDSLPTTIFTVMTNLAIQHGSVNLGQGFPDDEGPKSMKVRPLTSLSARPQTMHNSSVTMRWDWRLTEMPRRSLWGHQ